MTKSVYVIGGPGSGKSTFLASVLDGLVFGSVEVVHNRMNARGAVPMRGHRLYTQDSTPWGLYLGVLRDVHPGTDALPRVVHRVGIEWLLSADDLPQRIVGEGLGLSTDGFLSTLHSTTDMLLVLLTVPPDVRDARFRARGSTQKSTFVSGVESRTRNRFRTALAAGVRTLEVDTSDQDAWRCGVDVVQDFLR